jgi:hypothetical protein
MSFGLFLQDIYAVSRREVSCWLHHVMDFYYTTCKIYDGWQQNTTRREQEILCCPNRYRVRQQMTRGLPCDDDLFHHTATVASMAYKTLNIFLIALEK